MSIPIKYLWVALFLVLGFTAYTFMLPVYKDQNAYHDCVAAIDPGTDGKDEAFDHCRALHVSARISLERYAFTLLLVIGGALAVIYARRTDLFQTSKSLAVAVGLGAVVSTVVGLLGSLHYNMIRGVYPHWADSLGIPIASNLAFGVLLLVWVLIHLALCLKGFRRGQDVLQVSLRRDHKWFLFLIAITSLFFIVTVVFGDFQLVLPMALWVYFYLVLMASRRELNVVSGRGELNAELAQPHKKI